MFRVMSQAAAGDAVPHLLTTQEVAERLRISVNSAHRLAESGELSSVRVGRLRRFRIADVTAYIERDQQPSRPAAVADGAA